MPGTKQPKIVGNSSFPGRPKHPMVYYPNLSVKIWLQLRVYTRIPHFWTNPNDPQQEYGRKMAVLSFCHCFCAAFACNDFTFAKQFWSLLQGLSPKKTVRNISMIELTCKFECARCTCANHVSLSREPSQHLMKRSFSRCFRAQGFGFRPWCSVTT